MAQRHEKRFPGESSAYRGARDELLEAEIKLRSQIEQVASLRRSLPEGGLVPEDYVFEEGPRDLDAGDGVSKVQLSDLFGEHKALILYSFMFGPEAETPCPMCTALLDSLNGTSPMVSQRVAFAVVAKAPPAKTRAWARSRDWRNLRLLSSGGNSYNSDYFAETPDGNQIPPCNVFIKTDDGIRHGYSTELLYAATEEGQHNRHVDMIWPLWNMLDLTPDGRGENWYPNLV